MGVPFYDFFQLHPESFQAEVMERFKKILAQNAYMDGEYNKSFEAEFAKLQGCSHTVLLANGTDALEIALQVYGIRPGDKVGVPGITFHATAEAVLNVGATPVFIDVDPNTGLMCVHSFKRMAQRHQLKAIMPVHIYGLPAPIHLYEEFCQKHGIAIVEDGAQAQGAFYQHNQKPVGSSNNLVTWSFYPTKNLGAFGDAGAVTTQSEELSQKVRNIGNHGRISGLTVMGRNSRCDHMQAAVLQLKLRDINELNGARKAIAAKMNHALADLGVVFLDEKFVNLSSWHLYPIKFKNLAQKLKVHQHLNNKQIANRQFYERPLSEEPALMPFDAENTEAKKFSEQVLCLPIHPFISDDHIQEMVKEIKIALI